MPANFISVISAEQLDRLFEASFERPVVLLKHSNTCGTSADIMYQIRGLDLEINVIVVQEQRLLSNSVAELTGRRHHSPQIFVLKDGVAVYHATHYGIDPDRIAAAVANGSQSE